MVHYHGTPINKDSVAMRVLRAKHAFISFVAPSQFEVVANVCQSFALDNGAYSFWKRRAAVNWNDYYTWCEKLKNVPGCDFAVIPDVIDGDEHANDTFVEEWPFGVFGVPVWHMHESVDRFKRLCNKWPKVAIGSSGDYAIVGSPSWWNRMSDLMNQVCSEEGLPPTKLHGLRMMNPEIYTKIPFSSVDSTNVARNIAYDKGWVGTYVPSNKEMKAIVLIDRIESYNGALKWNKVKVAPEGLFF
jgi:hypothetical protein